LKFIFFLNFLKFIFSPDGVSGTCYEHSPAEGIVLVQIIEKALENVQALQQEEQQQHEQQQLLDDNGQQIRVGGGRCRRSTLTTLDDDDVGRLGESGGAGARTITTSFPAPKRLTWKIDEDIRTAIETAANDVDRYRPSQTKVPYKSTLSSFKKKKKTKEK
jgi:hypothetical protein